MWKGCPSSALPMTEIESCKPTWQRDLKPHTQIVKVIYLPPLYSVENVEKRGTDILESLRQLTV